MFEAYIQKVYDMIPHMDFDGQKRAERYFQSIIVIFAITGLILGYTAEQFSYTVYTLGVGFILASLLTLPPWPMYRRKNLEWQKPKSDETVPAKSDAVQTKSKKKNK